MAPINLPDGSQVSEIVLPDGSTALEVLAPDGSTVFSAIPDSDLYYKIDEGSGDELTDNNGSNSATSNGSLVWVEDADVGHGYYIELDGSNYLNTSNNPLTGLGTDFTVGIEIVVDSAFSSNTVFFNWGDGSDRAVVGVDGSSGDIGSILHEDGSVVDNPAHTQPSAPYNIDLVLSWDASEDSAELYLDEVGSTTSQNISSRPDDTMAIGAQDDGTEDMGGEGVARFAVWDGEVVDPSNFTL